MHKFVFIPVGGLANRMRALASALTLARKSDCRLQVIWFQDWALHAPFHSLFQEIRVPDLALKEAAFSDCLYDRPRQRNLYFPRLFQQMRFRGCLYEKSITPLCKQNFDFTKWARQGDVYMASYTAFQPYSYELLRRLFVPQPEIQRLIDRRCARFAEGRTIGVHIRRTDNTASIRQSPIELFFAAIDRELAQHPDLLIYLATDSESVKQEMNARYGERLICAEEEADRNSTAGIQGGVVDMYTLARTHKIYGSFQSSFSELAAQLGDVPLEIVKRDRPSNSSPVLGELPDGVRGYLHTVNELTPQSRPRRASSPKTGELFRD